MERRWHGATLATAGLCAAFAGTAHAQPASGSKGKPPPLPASSAAPPDDAPTLPSSAPTAAPSAPPGYAPATPPAPARPAPASPAPPAAQAPAPYYDAPPQGPTYYAPPAAPPVQAGPPAILPWDPADPVPEGYMPQSKPAAGYLGIGIGMLSAGWATSAVVGIVLYDSLKKSPSPTRPSPDVMIPLYFPVAGPFVTAAMLKAGPGETGLLLCDGIFQVAGAVGIVTGALKRTYRLVRAAPVAELTVTPVLGPSYAGITGTF